MAYLHLNHSRFMAKNSKEEPQSFGKTVENLVIFVLSSLFSGTKPVIVHIFYVFVGIFIIYSINDIFSFTDDYRTNDKIEQISKIESILKANKVDSLTYQKIKIMEFDVINKKPHLFRLYEFLESVFVTIPSSVEISIKNRNWLIHIFSSGYLTISGLPFLPFLIYFSTKQKTLKYKVEAFFKILTVASIFVLLLSIFNYLVIPTFDNIIYNYLANAILSTLIALIFIVFLLFKKFEDDGDLQQLDI